MIQTAKRLDIVEEYYFSSKLREVRQLASEGKPIINMGIGSPDLRPSQTVIDAVTLAMQEENAHQYQSYQGLPELRKGMADFYQNNYGVALNFNTEILPLMGSKEGIMHISLAFLNEGDHFHCTSIVIVNLCVNIASCCSDGDGLNAFCSDDTCVQVTS